MITLKEIASQCNVSIATVSNILNGKSNVSEDTKQRVLQIIQDTGYKPNYMARGLRANKTKTVGLIIDDITEFSTPMLIDGIMAYFEENGYKTILENLRFYSKWGKNWYEKETYIEDVQTAIQEFQSIKVDGIIYVAGHCRNIDSIPADLPIPVVICYAFNDSKSYPSVIFDDKLAAYQMTNYLIKKGHKRIAVIKGSESNFHTKKRFEGFLQAMEENRLPVWNELVYTGDWSFESGLKASESLINTGKDFTAIFCFNDLMAAGTYSYMTKNEITPGEDIAIVGFDNRPVSTIINPPLTTMEIPLKEIGTTSARLLLEKINSPEQAEIQDVLIECKLVERNSVTNNNI